MTLLSAQRRYKRFRGTLHLLRRRYCHCHLRRHCQCCRRRRRCCRRLSRRRCRHCHFMLRPPIALASGTAPEFQRNWEVDEYDCELERCGGSGLVYVSFRRKEAELL